MCICLSFLISVKYRKLWMTNHVHRNHLVTVECPICYISAHMLIVKDLMILFDFSCTI